MASSCLNKSQFLSTQHVNPLLYLENPLSLSLGLGGEGSRQFSFRNLPNFICRRAVASDPGWARQTPSHRRLDKWTSACGMGAAVAPWSPQNQQHCPLSTEGHVVAQAVETQNQWEQQILWHYLGYSASVMASSFFALFLMQVFLVIL